MYTKLAFKNCSQFDNIGIRNKSNKNFQRTVYLLRIKKKSRPTKSTKVFLFTLSKRLEEKNMLLALEKYKSQ